MTESGATQNQPEEKPEILKIVIFLALVIFVGFPMGNYFSKMIQTSKERLIAEQGIQQIPLAIERYFLLHKAYPTDIKQLIPDQLQGVVGYDFKPFRFEGIQNLKLIPIPDKIIQPTLEFELVMEGLPTCKIRYQWTALQWNGDPGQNHCSEIKNYFNQRSPFETLETVPQSGS